MDSHERNLFAEFERQPYVDLTEWRLQLVEYNQALLHSAEEELHRYGAKSMSRVQHETLINRVMSGAVRSCVDRIEPLVQPGDRICVRGDIMYDIYTASRHDFELERLGGGCELHGRFETAVVRDYVDEGILDIDPEELTGDHIAAHIRYYGPHLVLADPYERRPDGGMYPIKDCESALIPLMYRRLHLSGSVSWDMEG